MTETAARVRAFTAAHSETARAFAGNHGKKARAFARAHWLFLLVLVPAVALRTLAVIGYPGVLWFPDSYAYVHGALTLDPDPVRPSGYSVFLWLLTPFHNLTVVAAAQHLMGLAIAVLLYALLRHRFRLPAWGAVLATLPVLYDAFQIELEHLALSDTLFALLVMAAVTLLLWRPEPSTRLALSATLLAGLAATVRTIGLPLLIVVLGWLVLRRIGWRALAVAVVVGLLPVGGYALWFAGRTHRLALTGTTGIFLYSRTMAFADCAKIDPPTEEVPLCVSAAPGSRPDSALYIWGRISPLHRVEGDHFSPYKDHLAGDLAKRAILAQPGDYLSTVGADLARTFDWRHPVFPDADTYRHYLFRKNPVQPPRIAYDRIGRYAHGRVKTGVREPYAGLMRAYQRYFYLRGAELAVIMLLGLVAVVRRRLPALLPFAAAAALLVVPPATAEFDYRYVLPAVPLACLAAALAFTARPAAKTVRLDSTP